MMEWVNQKLSEQELLELGLELSRRDIQDLEALLQEAADVLGPEYDPARAQEMRVKIMEALGEEK